jgi:hypothetical protein
MQRCNITKRWVPVVVKHYGKEFERFIYDTYEISEMSLLRNKKNGRNLTPKNDQIALSYNGVQKKFMRYRVCLMSFFPNKIPKDIHNYDVDHIDGVHSNNHVSNLQWLTKSDHARKTQAQIKGNRKSFVEKKGKRIVIIYDSHSSIIGPCMTGREFDSITCASKTLELNISNIFKSLNKGYLTIRFKFKYIEQDLRPGEYFIPLGPYMVSNRGRYKNKHGKITTGYDTDRRYRRARVNLNGKTKGYLMHSLVWMAFNGPVPPGMVVMHNDTYDTLDEFGYERNYLEDLTLGTQKQNTQSYRDNTTLKRVRCIDDNIEFRCIADAAKYCGVYDSSPISRVCNKKQKTCKGKRFEYI